MEEEEGNSSFQDLAFPSNNSDELVGNTSGMTSTRQDDHIELLTEAICSMSPFHHGPHMPTIHHETPSSFCANPIHLHSLTRLTNIKTIVRSRFSTCAVCEERISLVAGDVVTCLACSIFLHRRCSQNEQMRICAVNEKLLEERKLYLNKHTTTRTDRGDEQNQISSSTIEQNDGSAIDSVLSSAVPQNLASTTVEEEAIVLECSEGSSDSSSSLDEVWSDAGPPAHWALSSRAPEALKGIKSISDSKSKPADGEFCEEQDWRTAFSNLSRVLHFNAFANGNDNVPPEQNHDPLPDKGDGDVANQVVLSHSLSDADSHDEKNVMENSKAIMQRIWQTMQSQEKPEERNDYILQGKEVSTVLKEAEPNPPTPTKTQRAIQGSADVVRKTKATSKYIGVASIAGGIAGATAGLIVAGPAGAYVGSRIGQAVGVAGVLIEGTIGVTVLVAGVTGTILTVKQLKGDENRMLAIGGEGSEQVVLVRPNVVVNPIWEEITMNARRSAPKDNFVEGLALFGDKVADKKERKRRDHDIVFSEEEELNTKDKVFLLVTSSLNDKRSLPGYVYRELIGEVKSRARARTDGSTTDAAKDTDVYSRAMRQDIHGIIKHITATLLEVRPGFCSSPRITELSAMAIETIVFGEVYDHVMEEIKRETSDKDMARSKKVNILMDTANALGIDIYAHISEDAIRSIEMLPSYHSVEEKLRCCVELLQLVSDVGCNANMGADFLLTLVCQHLALAKVPYLNAECAFLEEFAKDEILLQGKEGYALVTIQASIHFLNATKNIVQDLFLEI